MNKWKEILKDQISAELNEQIDILISCGVASDELQAKEVLDPIAAKHAQRVHAELRTTMVGASSALDKHKAAGAAFESLPDGESSASSTKSMQSSSSSSLLSNSPNDSPGASYRNQQSPQQPHSQSYNTTVAVSKVLKSHQYRHSSPALVKNTTGGNKFGATREVNAQQSALAAMQVARLRASRRASPSTGRVNLPDKFAENIVVGDTLALSPNEERTGRERDAVSYS